MSAALVVLLASSVLAIPGAATARPARPRVVVAVIDTAPNPYHEWFNKGGPIFRNRAPSSVTPSVLKEFGIDRKHIIEITRTGNFARDFARDKKQFDAIKKGEAYWFKGTNIIGISWLPKKRRLRPDGNTSAHGVGTSGSVTAANPQAVVVVVESPGAPLGVPGFATRPVGEKWAFTHPAVDIVSTSYGPPFSPPLMYHLNKSYKGVVGNGKLHFGAADNSPAASPVDATSGPWWVIGVAGFEEGSSNGRQIQSGSLPDFVGDWTQELPYCRNCEKGLEEVSGTSFATPTSAGVASRILLHARRAAGHRGGISTKGKGAPAMVHRGKFHVTNWDLRRALENAAYYPRFAQFEPSAEGSLPVVDQAPWLTTGWGLLTPDPRRKVVNEALARLGFGDRAQRKKGPAPCAFMTANIEARVVYWTAAVFSESFATSKNPYIYC